MRVVIPGVYDLIVTQDVRQHVSLDLVVWAGIVVGPHVQLLRWDFVQRKPPGRVMPVAMLASGHDKDRVACKLRLMHCVDYVPVWWAIDRARWNASKSLLGPCSKCLMSWTSTSVPSMSKITAVGLCVMGGFV